MARTTEIQKIPHSWNLKSWPSAVWPHTPQAVRWLVMSKRTELEKAGALVRPGRTLVILGPQFLGWLQRQGDRVPGYSIAPNTRRKARAAEATA